MMRLVLLFACFHWVATQSGRSERDAVEFLKGVNDRSAEFCNKLAKLSWIYQTNLTEYNQKLMIAQKVENVKYRNKIGKEAALFPWRGFKNQIIRRQFKFLADIGIAALPEDKVKQVSKLEADMEENYAKSKICEYTPDPHENKRCDLSLEPDLVKILKTSKNYEELKHVWLQWRDKAGKPMKEKFTQMVKLLNEAAVLNGFGDAGESWRDGYETDNLVFEVQELMNTIKPLYRHLHAYVRKKLSETYGEDKVSRTGPIPAHLLGNMWSQSWASIAERMMPFPDKPKVDVTEMLVQKRYSVLDIFKESEKFFVSLGLDEMTSEFWNNSMIKKPTDREVVCHASAWDFCDKKDFRIKQCTDIDMEDFIVTHHEMGHIQYYQLYADQPYLFQDGANPGFHEALGDLMSLSVVTPKHLQSIGLLEDVSEDYEGDINFLFSMAMDKVAFLPFGFLMDNWRWRVFSGQISQKNYNKEWWNLRLRYQGIEPPVPRSDDEFDPAAKFHISANVPYVRYFVATVLQFQFHEYLCKIAGHKGPLHTCDIYNSKQAGDKLRQVFSLGSSVDWREQMKMLSNGENNKMDTSSIMKYFKPLLKWLEKENEQEHIGWRVQSPNSYVAQSENEDTGSSPKTKAQTFCIFISFILTKIFTSLS